jgi:hypothetical protein
MQQSRWLGAAAILGGLSWFVVDFLRRQQWGVPGMAGYETYEFANRLMPIPLLLMIAGLLGFYRWQRSGRRGFYLGWIGLGLMIAGNVAEFWFFTNQPYGAWNGRTYAWCTFLLGVLLLLAGLFGLGWVGWRTGASPRWLNGLLVLVLPLEIATFFAQYLLEVTAVLFILLGLVVMWQPQTKMPVEFVVQR